MLGADEVAGLLGLLMVAKCEEGRCGSAGAHDLDGVVAQVFEEQQHPDSLAFGLREQQTELLTADAVGAEDCQYVGLRLVLLHTVQQQLKEQVRQQFVFEIPRLLVDADDSQARRAALGYRPGPLRRGPIAVSRPAAIECIKVSERSLDAQHPIHLNTVLSRHQRDQALVLVGFDLVLAIAREFPVDDEQRAA